MTRNEFVTLNEKKTLPKERANRPLLTVVRGRPQSAVGSARAYF